MISIRLPKYLQDELDSLCKQKKMTRTDIVKEALVEYIKTQNITSYEAGKDLFGCDDSDITNGSLTYKQNVRGKINEKHSH